MPILEKDVDGPNSLPLRIDREVTNLGKFSACRRFARTIYLGSAPTAANALGYSVIMAPCEENPQSTAVCGKAWSTARAG